MDYMAEGLDVELVVAIDFTKSNGDPADPRFQLAAVAPPQTFFLSLVLPTIRPDTYIFHSLGLYLHPVSCADSSEIFSFMVSSTSRL